MDYMAANPDHFAPFVAEDFVSYVRRKRHPACHGNNLEMQAMSEMYNRNIEVYCYSTGTIDVLAGQHAIW